MQRNVPFSLLDVSGSTDIAFLLDGSQFVTSGTLNRMKGFISAVALGYKMSPSKTMVSVGVYGNKHKLLHNLSASKQSINTAIAGCQHIGGVRQIGLALIATQELVFELYARGGNTGKVVVLFVTGPDGAAGSQLLRDAVQLMKDNRIEFVVVAIGPSIDLTQYRSLVTRPGDLIYVPSIYHLPDFIHNILILTKSSNGELNLCMLIITILLWNL